VLALAAFLALGGLPAGAAPAAKPALPATKPALPATKPALPAADLLTTTGDTKLAGALEEVHLSLEAFGTVLQLPLGFISSLVRQESGQVRLELVNRDVLTGTLRNRVLAFATPSARMTIPVEKIKALSLRTRQAPPEATESLLVSLKNGDELAWMLVPAEPVILSLETSFSDPIRLQLDKVKELRFQAGSPDMVQMRNGDLLYGRLQDALLRVRTYYQPVEIPRSEVAGLVFLSKQEVKERFTGVRSAEAAPAPAGRQFSAAGLVIDAADPLADPRVDDAYQPFSSYAFSSTGVLAVAAGVPGVSGEKTGREIWIYRNGQRAVLSGPGEASSPAWSPDGRLLAYDFRPAGVSTSEIWVSAADGSSRRQLSRDGAGSHSSLAWSPDGQRLAYVARDYRTGTNGVWLLNLADGTPTPLLSSNFDYFSDLQWSPDGRKLLVVSGVPGAAPRAVLKLIDAATKAVGDVLPKREKAGVDDQPRWSPDGRAIAFSSDRSGTRQIWLAHADGTNLRRLTSGEESKDYPGWSPDGRVIMYWARRGGLGNLWLVNAGGGESVQLTSSGRITGRPEWSPDGRRIVFQRREQRLQLWTATLVAK
jgi:TolB protein